MSKHREVPEWLRPAIGTAVQELPVKVLRSLGADLAGSFTKPEAIRDAIERLHKGFTEVPGWLEEVLKAHSAASRTLGMLSPGAVLLALPPLRGLVASGQVDLALWLDSREEVRALAKPDDPADALPTAADSDRGQAWRSFVEGCLLAPHGCSLSAPTSGANGGTPDAGAPASASARDLERAHQHLRDANRRHGEEKRAWEARLAEIRKEHAQAEHDLRASLDAAEKRVSALQKQLHSQVRKEVQEVTDARLGAWFQVAVAEQEFLERSGPPTQDLLAIADQALKQQEETDRRHGNRAELRRRLEALRQRRDRLEQAQVEAFRPLSSIAGVLRRLNESIDELEKRLGDTGELLGAAGAIALAIAGATESRRLHQLGKVLGEMEAARVLPAPVTRQLQEQLERQRTLLSFPGNPQRTLDGTPNPRELFVGNKPVILLIDAYNLVGLGGEMLGLPTARSLLPKALQGLLPLLRSFAAAHPQIEVYAMVDSPVGETRNEGRNLRLIYSGGRGEHRADHMIEGQLRHLKGSRDSRPVLVVSADAEVCSTAVGLGAGVMAPEVFARQLPRRSLQG